VTRTARAQGDTHNFGRRVELAGSSVAKPRTLFWEWLVLGGDSPLRETLDAAVAGAGLDPDTFDFLPELRFRRSRARGDGTVERIVLEPLGRLSAGGRQELARAAGRSLAFFSWLGVSDLHWENLVLGRDRRGRLVFAPLDIELILADFASPTLTKLLPDADPEYAAVSRHAAGMRRLLPFLGKPVEARALLAMAAAYRELLDLLESLAGGVAEILAGLPELRRAPIRVCLRGTTEYTEETDRAPDPPFLAAELEQLARDDIPYFFRLYGRPGLRYYDEPSLRRNRRLPLRGDVPRLEPLLRLSNSLRSPSRRRLREQGVLLLLSAFDHPALDGQHEIPGLAVSFGKRLLRARFADQAELSCPRNLRAVVGSLYLPCRCGEVRAVFVPPVTRCTL
jgi:hypothetical protein